jgi:elongation factor P--beta-lysine ligase
MLETNRFQNAWQGLEQINAWHLEQEVKEQKQKLLIQERKRREQETIESKSHQQ